MTYDEQTTSKKIRYMNEKECYIQYIFVRVYPFRNIFTFVKRAYLLLISGFCQFQTTASDQTRVVIEDVQINYSGSYMCEVTVSPTFDALIQFANMTVVGK